MTTPNPHDEVNVHSINYLFGQIQNQLTVLNEHWQKQNGHIGELAKELSLMRAVVDALPCKEDKMRLDALERWKHEQTEKNIQRKKEKRDWSSSIKLVVISAIVGSSLTVLGAWISSCLF